MGGNIGDGTNSCTPEPKSVYTQGMEWVPGKKLYEMEAEIIADCYRKHNFNKSQTANALGISIRSIRNRFNGKYKRKRSLEDTYVTVQEQGTNKEVRLVDKTRKTKSRHL